jgi:cell division protein FtsB
VDRTQLQPTSCCRWSWPAGVAATVTAAVVMVILALFSDNSWLERSAKQAEISDARAEVAQLLRQRQEYEEQLSDLKDGHLAMERLARERLGLAKKGETIYRFDRPAS